jgi:membrane protein
MKAGVTQIPKSLKKAFFLLQRSNPMILAASTAFFTTFSLPPIIIILVSVLSLYFKSETISEELFMSIQDALGPNVEAQIKLIVQNFRIVEGNVWIAFGGFVFFIFVATTLLIVVQDSIHILWRITPKSTRGLKVKGIERFKAFTLILSIGVLFLISLLFDTSFILLRDHVPHVFHSQDLLPIRVLHTIGSLFVIMVWLTLVFKVLPDARVAWKVAIPGGMFTGLLFDIGKVVLGRFLLHGQIPIIFGASASFAMILLFIFYSSFIFYFGACFTYMYAKAIHSPILPGKHTALYEEKVVTVAHEAQ